MDDIVTYSVPVWLQTLGLVAGITIPVAAALIRWIKKRLCIVERINKRSINQSKALIILSNRLDDIFKESHASDHNLGPEIEEILKEPEDIE